MDAAINGSREISFTVISMTLSLVAVFIPVLLLGGLIGRLFQEFAVTIARGDPGVRLRLADADADALQPVAPPGARRTRSTAGSTGPPSAPGRRRWPGYERSLGWVMDHRGLAMLFSPGDPGRDAVPGPHRAEGLHPERGHRPAQRHDRDRRGHQLRRHGAAPARRRGDRAGGSQRRRLHVVGRGRRPEQLGQPGPAVHPPQAARPAAARRRRGGPVAHPQAGGGARDAGLHHQPAGDQHRRAVGQEPVPVHAAELRHGDAVRRRRARSSSGCTTCRGSPT